MQLATFARTKIQPPRFRAGLIERSELERRMSVALSTRRLVLLVAPAGFGKTAALSREFRRLPEGCAAVWMTVDGDDDLLRFLTCLSDALEPYDPPWRTSPEALANQLSAGSALRAGADEFLSVLGAIPVDRGVIALDDLHAVADVRVFEFVGLLVAGLPENWTIAIASRVDPPLSLARLRARRELAEFRQADLSFSRQEIQLLCGGSGAVSDEAADRLLELTDGWAAGVSLSLGTPAASGPNAPEGRRSRRRLFDYLATEVFDTMPQELRDFLLRCSVLPELSVSQCTEVSGNPNAAELLEEIEQRGLFASVLEGEELTLRLHDLFRDFLDDRLRRQFPGETLLLQQRAAQSERDLVRKMHLLLRAGDWSQAERLLADLAPTLVTSGESAQVARLVDQFPPHERKVSPELAYARGLCAWHEFEDPVVVETMSMAGLGFERLGRPRQALEARIFEAISLMFLGRLDEADSRAQAIHADPGVPEAEVLIELFGYWRTGIYGPVGGPAGHLARMVDLLAQGASAELWHRCTPRLYLMIGRPGVAAPMRRFVEGARAAARESSEPLEAAATVLDTWLLLWRGHRETARAAIDRLKAQSRWLGQPRSLRVPLMGAVVAFNAILGDKEGVRTGCEALMAKMLTSAIHADWRTNITAWAGRQAAAADDWPAVRQALQVLEGSNGSTAFPRLGVYALRGRLYLHDGRNDDALQALRLAAESSAGVDRVGFDAFVRVSLALAELRGGSPNAAWRVIEPLVGAATQTGEVGGVLLCGAAMLAELAQGHWGTAAPVEGLAVIGDWAALARRWRSEATERHEGAAGGEPWLSAREIEVLQCLAAGQSNKLIARALDLSPHTVKRHVARILDRLDLSSRGEAAAWYQEHLRR
ncbi:LuxR C-terminal-related transcriptional regulator [Variovorax soli]|uniref:LuxR family maltose regulon positive regulatory protein n=1 Tax=Variovorax soli TaxID=376815 RepID=A0ABU1NLR4_9BURK|nr:LuxR C-terminal-related transcriptional regulator [Variovorax soli]MDR6539394.1 LuxR family maltose regulon positive regulatory protein [Variovorax soli]